jgi:ADP-heptose:LPS heptosyltransferase
MKRILIVKTSSLGDIVHNLPVARDIRRHFPDARIDWVVAEPCAPLVRLHSAVRRVIPVALRRWRQRGLWAGYNVGSDAERKRSERIAQDLDRAEVPALESLDRLAVMLSEPVAVVGVATGLTHLAAAFGRPAAAIYCGTALGLAGVYGVPRAKNLEGPGASPSPQEALQALEPVGAF